jgi:outer membrane protein OmpU
MKTIFFATTAAGALLVGGIASAQGIALFGDARLGLGYNIDNDGGVLAPDEDGNFPDDLRAVSRVRFGVNMTGETDSGITFGATIRADNSQGGQGGEDGQRSGSVFVSGSWGALTFGDTNGADEQWVGDVPGNYSLTGLTDIDETRFISNGGSFGDDSGEQFAENPLARPTIRYDFDIAGFGLSLSSNRDLSDIGVGAGYAADFGGGSWSAGAGYYKFDSFVTTGDGELQVVQDANGNFVVVPGAPVENTIPEGEQWSVGLKGDYDTFSFGLTYIKLTSDTEDDGDVEADNLLLGASYSFDAFSVGGFYGKILSADGGDEFDALDGGDAYGLTAEYDLGGGASINGGIAKSYPVVGAGDDPSDPDGATIADFGIKMAF